MDGICQICDDMTAEMVADTVTLQGVSLRQNKMPFNTQDPFSIHFNSEDKDLQCVQFEVEETINHDSQTIKTASNSLEHKVEKMREEAALVEYRFRTRINYKTSEWSEPALACNYE